MADYERSAVTLSSLCTSVKVPLPEKVMAKDITDRAQQLIDNLNAKRKHDTHLIEEYRQAMEAQVRKSFTFSGAVEIPCPTCPTWSLFIQDKLEISIYLSLDKYKCIKKVNTILYFIF